MKLRWLLMNHCCKTIMVGSQVTSAFVLFVFLFNYLSSRSYSPPTEMREGNVCSRVGLSFCLSTDGPCNRYPWCIWPYCTGPPSPDPTAPKDIRHGTTPSSDRTGGAPGGHLPRTKISLISCSFWENLANLYVSVPPSPQGWCLLLRGILDPNLPSHQ